VSGLIFGYFGYLYGKGEETDVTGQATATPTVTQTASPIASASATTTTDVTADWKTYTNPRFAYSFKYPADYYIYDPSSSTTSASDGISNENVVISVYKTTATNVPAIVSFKYDQLVQALDEKIKTLTQNGSFMEATKTTVNGLSAYEGIDPGILSSYSLYVQKDASSANIQMVFDSGNKSDLATNKANLSNIQKQILSTFQFTK
jgi:hypothetical protein